MGTELLQRVQRRVMNLFLFCVYFIYVQFPVIFCVSLYKIFAKNGSVSKNCFHMLKFKIVSKAMYLSHFKNVDEKNGNLVNNIVKDNLLPFIYLEKSACLFFKSVQLNITYTEKKINL